MGSDDTLIMIIAGGAAIAIAANIGGFRDYLNKAFGGGGQPIIPISGQSGNCYNSVAAKEPNVGKPITCHRNRACGAAAGTTVAECVLGPGRCTDARKQWISKHGCKSKLAYSYEATFDRDSLAAVTVS
jgi:hypothetical protein